jgi:uncharacterized protein (UPF0305 family)
MLLVEAAIAILFALIGLVMYMFSKETSAKTFVADYTSAGKEAINSIRNNDDDKPSEKKDESIKNIDELLKLLEENKDKVNEKLK